jgi:hypothetical protein
MTTFDRFLTKIELNIIDPLITLLALGAMILFAYGVLQFIRGADNEEARKTGQRHIIYSIIGLVILFGAKTIVEIMKKVVGG